MRNDWLLAISDVVAERERQASPQPTGSSSATLPNGVREVRINHRELEAE